MKLQWMGEYRAFVEKLNKYANVYASMYNKEDYYGTSIPISISQIQVLEYLLENEELNQNMSEIAGRLGISPSAFTKLVNKLTQKDLLEKFYMEGNRKNIIIRVTDHGRRLYQNYSNYIYEKSFSKMFHAGEGLPKKYLPVVAKMLDAGIWLVQEKEVKSSQVLIPVEKKQKLNQN